MGVQREFQFCCITLGESKWLVVYGVSVESSICVHRWINVMMSNRVQSRPPFASNIDPPCAGWNPPGARQCDNQDENAPPLSLRSEGVARPRERQRRRAEKILAVAMAWRGTCRVRQLAESLTQ